MRSEEKYPVNSLDLVGGYIYTLDKSPLPASSIQVTILDSSVISPTTTGWVDPTITTQVNAYTVKVGILKGPGSPFVLAVGRYRVWFWVQDAPQHAMIPNVATFKVV